MDARGPRIIVKDDRDSSIGRGCEQYAWHYRPEMACIPRAAAASVPWFCTLVRLTEGYRDIRDTPDDHEDFNAFDITAEFENGDRISYSEYFEMAVRMKVFLGPDYGYKVHGERLGLHIHFRFKRRD